MFFIKFHNSAPYPIDIKMYGKAWNEKIVKLALGPEDEYTHEAYFTYKFFFTKSDTHQRLNASANGLLAIAFEGCKFQAKPGRLIVVYITGDKEQIDF